MQRLQFIPGANVAVFRSGNIRRASLFPRDPKRLDPWLSIPSGDPAVKIIFETSLSIKQYRQLGLDHARIRAN